VLALLKTYHLLAAGFKQSVCLILESYIPFLPNFSF